ncbi:MAG: preprotein translocase subunit YajC [Nocardioides sp.]
METLASLLPIIAFALIFWLLLVRPAQRRRKQIAGMQAALNVGDRVMMTSGIYGTVRDLDPDKLRLDIAEGVVVTIARAAVSEVVESAEAPATGAHAAADQPADPDPES